MSNELENRARAAVIEYAAARADHWCRSVIPECLSWGHLYGPFCLMDDDACIVSVVQAWKIGEINVSLQLLMSPLGAVQYAEWYIPKGLSRDDLPKRKRPDLIRPMEPREWGNVASHLESLLAVFIAIERRTGLGVSATPASLI